MKETSVWNLNKGDVLAKPVYSASGKILLREGTVLTDQQIFRLRRLKIAKVFIGDTDLPTNMAHAGREPEDAIREQAHRSAHRMSEQRTVTDILIGYVDSRHVKGLIPSGEMDDRFRQNFRRIFYDIASRPFLLEQLTALYKTDLFLFNHSRRVAVSSGVIGLALQFDYNQLSELAIGALCFDIGMTRLPARLVKSNKPLSETERAEVEKHTILGYQILCGHRDVPESAALCALQHHERYDGSGYPYRLRQGEIHPHAQIVAICDVYHALTSPRHYRNSYAHHEAIEFLFASGNKYFDVSLIKTFLQHICVYPVGSMVLLSNGKIGVVSSVDMGMPHRPVVKVVRDRNGSPVHPPYEIDLKNNVNVVIVNAL